MVIPPLRGLSSENKKYLTLCVLCAFAVNKYISYNMLPEKMLRASLQLFRRSAIFKIALT
jgi:hypothetical protein